MLLEDIGRGAGKAGRPGLDALLVVWQRGQGPVPDSWKRTPAGRWCVDLEAGTVTYAGDGSVETLVSIENVRGHGYGDSLFGSGAGNALQGGGGNDLIDGRGGDDLLIGDYGRRLGYPDTSGNDILHGGDGNDVLVGDFGDDVLSGGAGSDLFEFDTGSGDDRITDFESGVDSIALYGGLTITGWELRDSDGDGVGDSQAALLSDGSSILFAGQAEVPQLNLALFAEPLAYADLSTWL